MQNHYHVTAEHILIYGVSAIIVINLWKLAAVKLGSQPGAVGKFGKSMGALVSF